MMRILVSGGLGFVGLHLARCCAEHGAEVIAADWLEPDDGAQAFLAPVSERIRLRRLDVRQRDALEMLIRTEGVTHILHAAALTPDQVTEQAQMDRVLDVNLGGAVNAILAAARGPEVERLILFSSSGLYGAPPEDSASLQSEQSTLDLGHLYTVTKYSAELVLQRCAELSGKHMAALRLASIYGEMERPTGSREHMSHIWRLRAAQLSGRRVRVAGPAVGRDWLYAGDMAEAVWTLLCAPRWSYFVYNLGAGQALRFETIVELLARRGLVYEWVDDPEAADIAMRPQQARAPLDLTRLRADTGLTWPRSPTERMEQYLNSLPGAA